MIASWAYDCVLWRISASGRKGAAADCGGDVAALGAAWRSPGGLCRAHAVPPQNAQAAVLPRTPPHRDPAGHRDRRSTGLVAARLSHRARDGDRRHFDVPPRATPPNASPPYCGHQPRSRGAGEVGAVFGVGQGNDGSGRGVPGGVLGR